MLESTEVNLSSLFSQLAVFCKTLLYEPYLQNWWVKLNNQYVKLKLWFPAFTWHEKTKIENAYKTCSGLCSVTLGLKYYFSSGIFCEDLFWTFLLLPACSTFRSPSPVPACQPDTSPRSPNLKTFKYCFGNLDLSYFMPWHISSVGWLINTLDFTNVSLSLSAIGFPVCLDNLKILIE